MGAKLKIFFDADMFTQIREWQGYFVDKTESIAEMLRDWPHKVLITRPRRFGKTVWLTMVQEFLDISRKGTKFFDGLAIMRDKDIVETYMNRYPVIFLSLKDVYGMSLEELYVSLQTHLSLAIQPYEKQIFPDVLPERLKTRYLDILNMRQDIKYLPTGLLNLSGILYEVFGEKVVVLVDEYDVPMARTYGKPFYGAVKILIEKMLSEILKTNRIIERVILTGCLDIAKASSYTGLNNIPVLNVQNELGSDCIGFTNEEVEKLLYAAGRPDLMETMRRWYDGYLFGSSRMYNPWDVLRYVFDVIHSSEGCTPAPKSYWNATSETQEKLLISLMRKSVQNRMLLDTLLGPKEGEIEARENTDEDRKYEEDEEDGEDGEDEKNEPYQYLPAVKLPLNDILTYENLYSSSEHLWTALLETGYLTRESPASVKLRVPNFGIKTVLRKELLSAYTHQLSNEQASLFMQAFWQPDNAIEVQEVLEEILLHSSSIFSDQYEYAYQYLLLGLFLGQGYEAQAEREEGYGRVDICVLEMRDGFFPAAVIETKHARSEKEMLKKNEQAKRQILRNKYYIGLKTEGYNTIYCYVMTFYKKRCKVEYVEVQNIKW